MPVDLLLPLKPYRHLRELVLPVAGTIRVLREVDVETFRVLRVIVIGGSEELDRVTVVLQGMKLRELEVFADSKLSEDVLVGVE